MAREAGFSAYMISLIHVHVALTLTWYLIWLYLKGNTEEKAKLVELYTIFKLSAWKTKQRLVYPFRRLRLGERLLRKLYSESCSIGRSVGTFEGGLMTSWGVEQTRKYRAKPIYSECWAYRDLLDESEMLRLVPRNPTTRLKYCFLLQLFNNE